MLSHYEEDSSVRKVNTVSKWQGERHVRSRFQLFLGSDCIPEVCLFNSCLASLSQLFLFFFFFGLMAFEIISKEKARMYYELGDHLLVPPSHFAANIQHRNHLAQVTEQVSGKTCTRVQVS